MRNNNFLIIYFFLLYLIFTFLSCNRNLKVSNNETVRDKIWLWGHVEGSHNGLFGLPSGSDGSKITMMEACDYMGIENCMVVEFNGKPEYKDEANYAARLSDCKRLGWSAVGAGTPNDLVVDHIRPVKTILQLSDKFANLKEVMFDDFFVGDKPRVTLDQLDEMHKLLHEREKPLDMWVVIYDFNLEKFLHDEYLKFFDVLNFWTWESNNLDSLESNLNKLRLHIPDKRIMLGCYMYDYGLNKPMSVKRMAEQCQTALRFLKDGSIEGIVFLASCICDLNLDAVEWTREWITYVGNYNIQEIDLKEMNSWTELSIQKYISID